VVTPFSLKDVLNARSSANSPRSVHPQLQFVLLAVWFHRTCILLKKKHVIGMRLQRFPFEMMLAVRFHRTCILLEEKARSRVGMRLQRFPLSRATSLCLFYRLEWSTIPWPFASETSALYSALLFPSIFRFNLELFTLKV